MIGFFARRRMRVIAVAPVHAISEPPAFRGEWKDLGRVEFLENDLGQRRVRHTDPKRHRYDAFASAEARWVQDRVLPPFARRVEGR